MNWLDIALLLFLVIALIRGYRSGFISQAIELGSFVLAWLLANPVSLVVIDFFANKGISLVTGWITWLISFLVVVVLSRLLLGFLLKGVGQVLGGFNRIAGALLSILVTTMLLAMVLNFYLALSDWYGWGGLPENSTIAPKVQEFGETILPTRLLIQQEVEEQLKPKWGIDLAPADSII